MIENKSDSVYHLINDLCKELMCDIFSENKINETDVRKLRSKSFEILLNKSNRYVKQNTPNNAIQNFEREICLYRFNMLTDPRKRKRCELLEEEMLIIKSKKYFKNDPGISVLDFLLNLEREMDIDLQSKPLHLLIPGPFTIQISRPNKYYPSHSTFAFKQPEYFQGITSLKSEQNPYLPNFVFQSEDNQLTKVENRFAIDDLKMCFNDIINFNKQSCKSKALKIPSAFQLHTNSTFNFPEKIHMQTKYKVKVDAMKSKLQMRYLNFNWENLQQNGIVIEKNYASEISCSLHLQGAFAKNEQISFEAKVVSLETFINDVKYLCVGVQSDSFYNDKNAIFYMVSNITIPNISPSVISNYVYDFLECGSCYKRLKLLIMKTNFKLMFEGFIFKALCGAVDEYLLFFHEFVFTFNDTTLLNFSKRMKKMINQIISLTYTLGINHNCKINISSLMGPNFLGFLYQEIMRIPQKDFIMLLVFVLKRCCNVYFKYLHKWIFYGDLDDKSNELFICFVDNYRPKTKYFYDKAYFVRKDYVPGFIQHYDDQILLCGKYTMLLKEFKPYHPLFETHYPDISVCLSFNEIKSMENMCEEYYNKARKICGKPITIRDLFERKKENRMEFIRESSKKSKSNMDKWKNEQCVIATSRAVAKQERFEEIVKNINDAKQRKLDERKANIQLELKTLREAEMLEDKLIQMENVNLKKRIEYYQELNDILDEKTEKINQKLNKNLEIIPRTISPISSEIYLFEDDDFKSQNGSELATTNSDCTLVTINENDQQLQIEPSEIKQNSKEVNAYSCNARDGINSEFEQNRQKILSGSNLKDCFNETVLRVDTQNNNKLIVTEAQKIKIKVLQKEYYYSPRDENSNPCENTVPIVKVSEAQKNRNKMMDTDLFTEYNKEPNRNRLNLDLNSELSRNRRKVLESEYNIMTGVYNTPRDTPMSTTSDIDLEIKECYINENIDDELNANANELNIDIQSSNGISDDLFLDIPSSRSTTKSYATSTITTSNEQTSGDYETPKSADSSDQYYYDATNTVLNSPSIKKKIDDSYYEKCEQLITSNFKCEPKNAIFRLQRQISSKNVKITEKDKEKENIFIKNRSEINSLNSITIANFLQMSVVTPLAAHLEILGNEVMRVFLEDLDILGHFNSLKNYFFLMDGEFGLIICDGIIGSLENGATPNELFSFQSLHTILNKALGSIIIGNDKNASRLSFIVGDRPEHFDLSSPSALSSLTLSYSIDWPLNLILNPETIEHYVIIFKYLIKVRRISWIMERSHQLLKEIVKKAGKSPQYLHVQQIRHKFLHFVNVLKHHITSNALQASWKTFEDDLITAESIEDIYRKHSKYIKRIMFLCMLNRHSTDFYNTIETIFKITLRFYGNLKSRQWKQKPDEKYYTHSRYNKLVADEVDFDKFIKYTIYLGNKIVRHGYQEEIGEFISLINYNNYYTSDG